jgi:4-alpha-glucanotransferase
MNTPSTPENNWTWRMAPDALTANRLKGWRSLPS